MQAIPRLALPQKFRDELHCNEVMLLPYYIAAMNIEHLYWELTGQYEPFDGICLVDTFELAEGKQMSLFVPENTERVLQQQAQDIFVIVGNPPYNAWQVNENDNNRNRTYEHMDDRVAETYSAASRATNKNALSDPYVKAFRWASERIGEEGVVAYVSNNGFLDGLAFDGMRKHLAQDFDAIYVLDLGGNVRKNPKLSGTTHNVFGIQVGVAVTFLVRTGEKAEGETAKIWYARTDEWWRKEEKYDFLDEKQQIDGIEWREIAPNKQHTWLTEGLEAEFEDFVPMGTKAAKAGNENAIFESYGNGVKTHRDAWAYNFERKEVARNIQRLIENYNDHVFRWQRLPSKPNLNDFISRDNKTTNWSRDLKLDLQRGNLAAFGDSKIRQAMYRPFVQQWLFFDRIMNEEVYQFPSYFPAPDTKNLVIIVSDKGYRSVFSTLMVNTVADLHALAAVDAYQCFPLYTYDEDGGNRRDNITDWGLERFREEYGDAGDVGAVREPPLPGNAMPRHGDMPTDPDKALPDSGDAASPHQPEITKPDIFYYTYALLHHPDYRERYAANLRRELPRLPFAPDFWAFAAAGRALAELHVNYEAQPRYPLEMIENADVPMSLRVEKMRLSKDGTQLRYNDFLTLAGIPAEAHDYRLGNRSALEWIVDQYRVTTDRRSGITNDPNRADDPEYILRLIQQVVTVSVETVRIVQSLPPLPGVETPG